MYDILCLGSGKTQLCLTLALRSQLAEDRGGLNGHCCYLSCCEGEFPIRRLVQISKQCEEQYGISEDELLKGVHIEQFYNMTDVLNSMNKIIPDMCMNNNIKLIIIDSIGGLMRVEYDTKNKQEVFKRTNALFNFARKLKWIASTFQCAVLVVNQVINIIIQYSFIHLN